jgi:dCTP deaminase
VLPVNTYADPGFEGKLGITLYNGSRRYILIRPGEHIAKIEFVVLAKPVKHPYSGQHGYETEMWPIASHLFADASDPSVATLIANNHHEIELSFGPRIAGIAKELQFYRSKVWLQIFLILAAFAALLAVHGYVSTIWSLGLGIVANLVTTLGINLWGARKP